MCICLYGVHGECTSSIGVLAVKRTSVLTSETIWVNLKHTVLNEGGQSQKAT
jgi:hypothetical protein